MHSINFVKRLATENDTYHYLMASDGQFVCNCFIVDEHVTGLITQNFISVYATITLENYQFIRDNDGSKFVLIVNATLNGNYRAGIQQKNSMLAVFYRTLTLK